ncbi:MAG: type 4a pilus biogenesis protein PilO [Candidatus Omnitrophica bacterium]|nr:type 4a pilus biogenesis protein PilO [Candidatus Omnitrophota bacterium]
MPKIQLDKLKEIKLGKTKKETLAFIIVGVILFIFLYFQIFLKVAISQIFALNPEIRKLKIDIKNTKEDLHHEEMFTKRLKNMEGKIDIYERKLPVEHEIPMLLEDLSRMAKDSYVKILGITPVSISMRRRQKESKVYREIPIMIRAKSGYHELATFINRLEDAGRFMELSDIKIKSSKPDFRRHDIELTVSTYVLLKE